ncbi:polysaccharide lyase family protein [Brachybacterium sp.]|uniref:polysaccharide lyase family protein n=1 Tax=Brachybacterium sp. TaxID=1891286 RepID=UPI002ED050D1
MSVTRPTVPRTAAPEVIETDTEIIVDNGRVRAVLRKEPEGRMTSLMLDGQELIGEKGKGRFDQNVTVVGEEIELPEQEVDHEIRRTEDAVIVTATIPPSTGSPYRRGRMLLVRANEPGFHLASLFAHQAGHPAISIEQHRYVCWFDPEIFTHASLEDDDFGEPWRASAAQMPTPSELSTGEMVMDATYDLAGLGSAYPRRHYTKYDWAISMRDHTVHGLCGRLEDRWIGAFAVLSDRSSFNGGPDRQDLTLHQTGDAPVLLIAPHATHYGSRPVVTDGDWSKTYGPHYVHLGVSDSPEELRAQAEAMVGAPEHAELYDAAALEGWSPTSARGCVSGQVLLTGDVPALDRSIDGALVILSDDGAPAQDTAAGFQHWTAADRHGEFRVDGVRPGTYRLTVRQDGWWDQHVQDGVEVDGDLRLTVRWRPSEDDGSGGESPGRRPSEQVWQIGSPDGTSLEFTGGPEARRYDNTSQYAELFPDGVEHVVGAEDAPWFFTQPQLVEGEIAAPWRITFDLEEPPPRHRRAELTIALAAWSLSSADPNLGIPSTLTVRCNDGAAQVWEFLGDDARGAIYRSAHRARNHRRTFVLAGEDLRRGENTIVLTVNDGVSDVAAQATYDALRLRIR